MRYKGTDGHNIVPYARPLVWLAKKFYIILSEHMASDIQQSN